MYVLYTTTFITMALLIHLSVVSFSHKSKRMVNKVFAGLMACLFFWVFTNLMANLYHFNPSLIYWSKAAIVGPAFIPALVLHFTYLFPKEKRISKFYAFIIYVPALVIVFLSPTSYNVESLSREGYLYIMNPGPVYKAMLVYVLIYVLLAGRNLRYSYHANTGRERLQILYISIGVMAAFAIGLFTNLVMVLAGHVYMARFGYLGALVLYIFIYHAICKHRLMGIRFLATKLFVFLFSTLFVVLFFYVANIVFTYLSRDNPIFALLACFLLSYLFVVAMKKYSIFVKQTGDVIFYRSKNPLSSTELAAISMLKQKNIKDLHFEVFRQFNNIVAVDNLSVIIFPRFGKRNIKTADLVLSFNYFDLNCVPALYDIFQKKSDVVYVYEMSGDCEAKSELEEKKVKVVFPIQKDGNLIGLGFLREKRTGSAYSREDLCFVKSIIPYLYSAYSKTIKMANIDSRINENELLHKTFADMAGRQILTPSNIIRKLIQKAKEAVDSDDDSKKYLESAIRKTSKFNQAIRKFLLISVIDDKRFSFSVYRVNIANFIEMVLRDIIGGNNCQIVVEYEGCPSRLNALTNETYLREVINEIIDNALIFSNYHKLIIKISKNYKRGVLVIGIKDAGIGIPDESKLDIFKKFFQAGNAIRYNQDGVGVGLYIANKIISMHRKGRMYIGKTERGVGTIMVIELPLVK